LPWYIWSAVFWAACGLLGYLKIDLSAKVITVLLLLELCVVAIFDLTIVAEGGGSSGLASPTWTVPPQPTRSGT
jgi:amino acid transporter